jgi:hypothetical protein
MCAAASFERDDTSGLASKELEQLGPGQLATEHHRAALVSAMRVENVLGDIQTNGGNL